MIDIKQSPNIIKEFILPNVIRSIIVDQGERNTLITFYEKLLYVHPNLTKNERQICGLIIVGFSSSEIAEISKSRIHSVEVARTRLRKKVGITNQSFSLFEYLIKI